MLISSESGNDCSSHGPLLMDNPSSSSVVTCDICEDQRCVHCEPGKRGEGQEKAPDAMFSLT